MKKQSTVVLIHGLFMTFPKLGVTSRSQLVAALAKG